MNIFSRAIMGALLLGGTTQPMDWKYILSWTAAAVCFGGCIHLSLLSKQDSKKIMELDKKVKEKDSQIKGLQERVNKPESISKKGLDIKSMQKLGESASESEELKRLRAELVTKDETIKNDRKLIDNYWPLIDATDKDSTSENPSYTLKLNKLDPKVLLSFRINKETYLIVKESEITIHPLVAAFISARNPKDTQIKSQALKNNPEIKEDEKKEDSLIMAYHNVVQKEAVNVPPPPLLPSSLITLLPVEQPPALPVTETNRNSLSEFKTNDFDLLTQNLGKKQN